MGLLSSGVWLTARRVRAIATISGVLGAAMIAFLALAGEGTLDPFGQPIGTDFSAFWHAGRIVNGGNPAAAWDPDTLNAAVRATHVGSDFATAWVYPPVFLLAAAPLAELPYLPALFLWHLLGVIAITWALGAILKDRLAVLVCLASPLTPIVLGHGQNAFLTSALLGGGLLALTAERQGRAGLFGALACKPQLALQLAPLLLFTKSWSAIVASILTAAILVGTTVLLWGADAWLAFIESSSVPRRFMEEGAVGHHKGASLFSTARHWGAGLVFSYSFQAAAAVSAMALLWRLRTASPFVLSAAACAAIALSTPYLLDYDMAVVGLGAVFLYAEARKTAFLTFEKTALAYIWVAPWFGRQAAELAYLPLLPLSTLLLAVLACRRAAARPASASDKAEHSIAGALA